MGRSPLPIRMSSTPDLPASHPARAAPYSTRAPRIPLGVPYNDGALGRCAVSEKADRDDRRDDRSWLDALTKKEEQKLIALLRQRYPQRGDERRGKTE